MFILRHSVWLLGGLLCLSTGRALGGESRSGSAGQAEQQVVDVASRHFSQGVVFFRLGSWTAARVEFEAAYALSKAPDLLHNLSLVAERQGQLAEAVTFEEQFRASKGKELSEQELADVDQRLSELQGQLPEPPPAGTAPPAATSVAAAALLLTPPAAPLPRRRPPPLALALIGAGSGLLAVGIGCGISALLTARSVDAGGFYRRDLPELFSRGQSLDRAGIALDLIGTAALAGGVVFTIVDRLRPARSSWR
jgi:hypothetical protein